MTENVNREEAIKLINENKQLFSITNLEILSDNRIVMVKKLPHNKLRARMTNSNKDKLLELAAVEIHSANNVPDLKPDSTHFFVRGEAYDETLALKSGCFLSHNNSNIHLFNHRFKCDLNVENIGNVNNLIELANGFIVCTGHDGIYIINLHNLTTDTNQPAPNAIAAELLPPKDKDNNDSNPIQFCKSFMISKSMMLTTACKNSNRAFIWDLSDLMENHHPKQNMVDHSDNLFDDYGLSNVEQLNINISSMVENSSRVPVATIDHPDYSDVVLPCIYDGKAMIIKENGKDLTVWDFFTNPIPGSVLGEQ